MVTVKVRKQRDPFTGESTTVYYVEGIPPMFAHIPAKDCLKVAEYEDNLTTGLQTLELVSERREGDKVFDIKRHHHTQERHSVTFRSPGIGPVEIMHKAWRTIT